MKKFGFLMSILLVFVVLVIVLTFLYIDMSGHKSYTYNIYSGDKKIGETVVDRFVTEDKVVYKGTTNFSRTTGYPVITEKLFLDRKNKYPIKFEQEAIGPKKNKRIILLTQNGETSDYLYLEDPKFFKTKDFPTGIKTSIFLPTDIMLYIPIMNKYNYWKKGAQFFEIMMPLPEKLPPLRDKIGVKFVRESFEPIMGKRVEADKLVVQAGSLPDIDISVARHTHLILSLTIKKTKIRYELADYELTPTKKFISRIKEAIISNRVKGLVGEVSGDRTNPGQKETFSSEEHARAESAYEEVLFQREQGMLSSELYLPDGDSDHPAVLFVTRDGPGTNGEEFLTSALGKYFMSNGIVFMNFDSRDQSKSKGLAETFAMYDDERIKDINSAVAFLTDHTKVDGSKIYVLGHKSGGSIAIKAANDNSELKGAIVLGIPQGTDADKIVPGKAADSIKKMISKHDLREFDDGFFNNVKKEVVKQQGLLDREEEDFYFFMGRKIPVKRYKDVVNRQGFDLAKDHKKPILFIFTKNDEDFDPRRLSEIKKILNTNKDLFKVAELRGNGEYFGEIVEGDEEWYFKTNEEMLPLIRDWIKSQ